MLRCSATLRTNLPNRRIATGNRRQSPFDIILGNRAMSINADSLRKIHRLHIQLEDVRERLERGPKQIKGGENRLQALEKAVAAAKDTLKRTKLTIHEKELNLKEREGRILDIRGRLNSCSTNKEYQAYIEQIAADEQANSVLADEIIDLFDKATNEENAIKSAEAEFQKCQSDLDGVRRRIADERDGLERELARLAEELRSAEEALPPEVKNDYQRVVKAHGDEALAPLDAECCGGCNQRITAQMVNELAMDRIVFCKSCGRILYLPEDSRMSRD